MRFNTVLSILFVSAAMGFYLPDASAEPLDLSQVAMDLAVPPMVAGLPAAGSRVAQTHPDYVKTDVYHALYLPTDWKPGTKHRYPVIVEFAGNGPYRNKYSDISTGKVEGSRLGFGISGGENYIWICMPFLNHEGTANVTRWWGNKPQFNPQPTVDYCQKTLGWICEQYGGDWDRVLLTGFSRGAIACNYIGLHDDEISRMWRAMVVFSHYDGVRQWEYPFSDKASAMQRLQRLGNCPQFICAEGHLDEQIQQTRMYMRQTGVQGDFAFHTTGFRNHNDAWVLRPGKTRSEMRLWVTQKLSR